MRTCVLLILQLQGISGDEIQKLVTLGVIPKAQWKIPVLDTSDGLWISEEEKLKSGDLWIWGWHVTDLVEYMETSVVPVTTLLCIFENTVKEKIISA